MRRLFLGLVLCFVATVAGAQEFLRHTPPAGALSSRTITGGTGITVADGDGVAGNPTITADVSVIDTYTSGTATPSAACSPGELYFETDINLLWGCNSTNTWTSNVTGASTHTLTNKTFDANGTGNALSNVDVADLANGTDGQLITWDAAGAPAVVAVGTINHVLTSGGTGVAPTFQAAAGGGMPLPNVKRVTYCALGPRGGAGFNCLGAGTINPGGTGAITLATSTEMSMYGYATGATTGNQARAHLVHGSLFIGHSNYGMFRVILDGTTARRHWVGFFETNAEGTIASAADPATDVAAFRFDTGASDTNWQCVTNDDSAGGTITDSGVAADTSGILMEITETNATNWVFTINGSDVCTHTTNLPTKGLTAGVMSHTLADAAKTISSGYWYFEETLP